MARSPETVIEPAVRERPEWLKVRATLGDNYRQLKGLLRGLSLHSVCEEALCPNIYECFDARAATFLILGDVCTRRCSFCAIASGRPVGLDREEPRRVARAAQVLGLRHVVVTSVTRDDLAGGGAAIFAETIARLRESVPDCSVEVLVPDFGGSRSALEQVMAARPDILNHNVETVPRLYRRVRPSARYYRSLELLQRANEVDGSVLTKSGLMVGLGETWDEILSVLADLRGAGCDIATIGQYLRPSSGQRHAPAARYYTPEEFERLKEEATALGFRAVESGPLVRSSYHARNQVEVLRDT
jgi:lipoic acid synthetase